MTTNELQKAVDELRELTAMNDELNKHMDVIRNSIKEHMAACNLDVINGMNFKITWNEIATTSFDSKAFKVDYPELAEQYTRRGTTRRFCLK